MSGVSESNEHRTATDGQLFNVQCANSTDFIVGRQTNFHAPVTIISCPDQKSLPLDEKIVIRDELWTKKTQNSIGQQLFQAPLPNGELEKSLSKKDPPPFQLLVTKPVVGIPLFAWILIILAITIGIVIVLTQFTLSGVSDISLPEEPINPGDGPFLGDSTQQRYFRKKDWGGLNASSIVKITDPVKYVVISHTAGTFCYETVTCPKVLRNIQKYQMSQDPPYADISSNFLVGGDGNIYEGRGWGRRSPHEGFSNNRNIDITFIGDFSVYDVPTPAQASAAEEVVAWGLRQGHISQNYSLIAHNATGVPTLSPGINVYRIISEWDHFDPNPVDSIKKKSKFGK